MGRSLGAAVKEWLKLWPFVGLDVVPVHTRPITEDFNTVMEYIFADPVKRANFEASLWREFDRWKERREVLWPSPRLSR